MTMIFHNSTRNNGLLRATLIAVMLTCILSMLSTTTKADDPPTILLWPEGQVPGALGQNPQDIPFLSCYPADPQRSHGGAIMICPGGAYRGWAGGHEGAQVAAWFNEMGFSAFVLKYRLRSSKYEPPVALGDALQAIRVLREKASELNFDPQRLGMIGFSAGGHLAGMTTLSSSSTGDASLALSRPDFTILIYPAYLYTFPETEYGTIPAATHFLPPTFIAVTTDDKKYWESSPQTYLNFVKAGADVELHAFSGWGPHGMGMAQGGPAFSAWTSLCRAWLRNQRLLTRIPPCQSLTGSIRCEQFPINDGWIQLTPVNDEQRPIVAARIGKDGVFNFQDPRQAPCLGDYHVHIVVSSQAQSLTPQMTTLETSQLTILTGENHFDLTLAPVTSPE